jgi:hypothetical protein
LFATVLLFATVQDRAHSSSASGSTARPNRMNCGQPP